MLYVVSLDCEHSYGVMKPWEKGFYLTNVGVVTNRGEREVFWFEHSKKEPTIGAQYDLQRYIDNAHVIVGHNLKHDINILRYYGLKIPPGKLWCTQVADYLLEGHNIALRYDLNSVSARYGYHQKLDEVREYWNKGVDTKDIPAEILHEYVLEDCAIPLYLHEQQVDRMKRDGMLKIGQIQMKWLSILSEMELNGFVFDVERAYEIIEEYKEIAKEKVARLREIAGDERFNPASGQQVSCLLFGGKANVTWKDWVVKELKVRPESTYREVTRTEEVNFKGVGFTPDERTRTKSGHYSTDKKKVLLALKPKTKEQKEVKQLLLDYSNANRVITTLLGESGKTGLITKVQPDGKIHPTFHQTVTRTGRLSSSDPNGQNLPRGDTSPIKQTIKPSLDGVMEVDASQIEWRGAGELSGDEVMIHEINTGVDQHIATVKDLMELPFISKKDPESNMNRFHAKTFNFRMIYGGSHWGFYLDPNMPDFSKTKWKRIHDDFYFKYKGLKFWQDTNIATVNKTGELRIKTGRRFVFEKRKGKDGLVGYAPNQVKNYPIQGLCGGDLLPLAAAVIDRGLKKYGFKSKWMLTVHDSLIFDYVEEEKDKLMRLCRSVFNNLDIYAMNYYRIDWQTELAGEVKIGPNYGQLKEVE